MRHRCKKRLPEQNTMRYKAIITLLPVNDLIFQLNFYFPTAKKGAIPSCIYEAHCIFKCLHRAGDNG